MSIEVNGKTIEVDGEGFLLNPDDWSEEVGLELVRQHEAAGHRKVTETGWMLIKYFRDFYEEHMRHPSMNELIREHEKHEGKSFKEEVDYKQNLYELFPHGPIPMVAKLAGLPHNAVTKEMED